jgi:hypothetical protein
VSTLTPEQQQYRDTHNMDRIQMLAAFGDTMRRVTETANRPTGGRRNMYIAAILLAEQKGIGFMELDNRLFRASETSMQTSFNTAATKHGKPHYVVYEHSTGRKVIFCPTHPKGNESLTRWHLRVEHGWTVSEINALAADYDAQNIEADDNELTETWVSQVIDELYDEPEADEDDNEDDSTE